MRNRIVFAAAAVMLVAFAVTTPVPVQAAGASQSILNTAIKAGSFKTLTQLVQYAGLGQTLRFDGPYTVFAPTDEAFAKLPPGTIEALKKDRAALRNILLYHVTAGRVTAADVIASSSIAMANGGTVTVMSGGGVILNGSSNVVATDIEASNGIIHVIDTVLLP
jgi:uncharacterized surface protein with fasciclin (FAS1) repeats